MRTLADFREHLDAMEWVSEKSVSRMIGRLPAEDRPEAGRLFNEAKAKLEKPKVEPTASKKKPKSTTVLASWSRNQIKQYEDRVEISNLIVVEGENLKVKVYYPDSTPGKWNPHE